MKKLRIILLFSIIILISYHIQSKYELSKSTNLLGTIIDYKIDGNKLKLDIKSNKRVIANYYFKTENEKKNITNIIKYGYKVKLKGIYEEVNNNTNFNLFNYKKFLLSKKIYYTFSSKEIKIYKNNSFIYNIKNKIVKKINKSKNKIYLKLFILGDNNLDENVKDSYKLNGISHLFAISGMHITLFTSFLTFLLKFINKNKKIIFIIICIFLLFYMYLVNFVPSVVRASLFYLILNIKKIINIKVSNFDLLLYLLIGLLIYNPFYIYNLGFLYSFIISLSLIYFQKQLEKNTYIISLLKTSIISFLISMPITINNNFEINLLTPLLNIIFVPFISFIIFPLSLINFIIPYIDNINFFFINVLERFSIFISNINPFVFIMAKISFFVVIIYYIIIIYLIKNHSKKNILIFILIIFIHYNITYFNLDTNVISIDVGQGDSTLIQMKNNKNILIDTGGKIKYKKDKWMKSKNEYSIALNTIIPLMKSFGIRKIDYLIITHGDFDHMGEAINLVNNFKVEKVIFNCGPYNNLEAKLIKLLNNKSINYDACINELNINNNKLYFLQTKEYDNENDFSNVIYTELAGYKFMFMGDASITTEKEIMSIYNLSDIDVLKVGHHGSKTSSSREFIDEIKPKYSVVSVGKNNGYGHPNKEVLDNLKNSKIYRTDLDGSIMFKIKNNKLKIETCI